MDNELTRINDAECPIKNNSEAEAQSENTQTEKSSTGLKVAAAAGTGLAIGIAATALTSATAADESEITYIDIDDDGDIHERTFIGRAPMSNAVTEDMTFGEAFAAARADVGPGGTFLWHGGVYGTYDAQEWNELSAHEQIDWQNSIQWNEVLRYQETYDQPEPVYDTDEPIEIDPEDPQETEPDSDEDNECGDDPDVIGEPNIPDDDILPDPDNDLDFADGVDDIIDDTIYNDI